MTAVRTISSYKYLLDLNLCVVLSCIEHMEVHLYHNLNICVLSLIFLSSYQKLSNMGQIMIFPQLVIFLLLIVFQNFIPEY